EPLKTIALSAGDGQWTRGELVISTTGVEGGGVYTVSRALREALGRGSAHLHINLKPDLSLEVLQTRAAGLKRDELLRRLRLGPVAAALLAAFGGPDPLAAIKDLIIPLTGTRPLAEAISSAG